MFAERFLDKSLTTRKRPQDSDSSFNPSNQEDSEQEDQIESKLFKINHICKNNFDLDQNLCSKKRSDINDATEMLNRLLNRKKTTIKKRKSMKSDKEGK